MYNLFDKDAAEIDEIVRVPGVKARDAASTKRWARGPSSKTPQVNSSSYSVFYYFIIIIFGPCAS